MLPRKYAPAILIASIILLFYVCLSIFSDAVVRYTFFRRVMAKIPFRGNSKNAIDVQKPEVHIAIAVCQSNPVKGQAFAENDRQFRQIKVMFKSAAVLTSTVVKYHIITDSKDVYQQLISIPTTWPTEFRRRLTFSPRRNLYNPPELGDLRNVFRPCATERLFMAQSLVEEDAMIYTDSDSFFMQPPEHLWALFRNFDIRQVAGVTPHLYHYTPPFNKFPFFGFTGLNSGVLLLNMTRIRLKYPNGWVNSIKNIINTHKGQLQFFDQDILNLLFSVDNGKYAYEVPCEWNYMFIFCNNIRNTCPTLTINGLALVHGVDTSFINDKGPKFKALFHVWEQYEMGSPVEKLISNMEKALATAPATACGQIPRIDFFFLKGIKKTLL